jgi:hypothetical protein
MQQNFGGLNTVLRIRNWIRNAWSDSDLEAKINVSDPNLLQAGSGFGTQIE